VTAATITSKGQMTLPKEVREKLGLKSGDRVDVQVRDDGTAVIVPRTATLSDLMNCLPKAKRRLSVEAIDAGIAKHLAREDRRSRP
jgi:antitoxin PrlF